MSARVFIDGAAGTTGLEIVERLSGRPEFTVLVLGETERKSSGARREAFRTSDFAVLCLPDDAAREAVSLAEGSDVRIIDASSAHRVAPGWTYGFPEVVGRDKVGAADRVSNPGCYPTGFIALLAPLIRHGLLPSDWPYTCHAVSGYSGGGKALIGRFEADPDIAYRNYALALGHKHVPEMQELCGLAHPPLFAPAVIPAHRGMVVEVPLHLAQMKRPAPTDGLRDFLVDFYAGSPIVRVHEETPEELLLRCSRRRPGKAGCDARQSRQGRERRCRAEPQSHGRTSRDRRPAPVTARLMGTLG
jgi:N-acetyl-gamma-glutamyl-phosphate reductase